ncbi:helix-turn-helix transcriptional regulator [Actinomadura madurae]|nr:Scr1 family TA system antitoxin-like transcriptional regulator [Actinomadura madurae]MCQ0015609.1 helix-turn-helix transcriptional regulator [Actinomadura madurae]
MDGRFRESPDPMESMWAWLAYDLRFYRLKHGLSGERFGRIIGVVRSTVSRLESGELKIDGKQAMALDAHFDTGGHFLRLRTYAELGHDPDWQKQYEVFEARATMMRLYHGQLIPALFQTPAYARALLSAAAGPTSRARSPRGWRARMPSTDRTLPTSGCCWRRVRSTALSVVRRPCESRTLTFWRRPSRRT